jgi:hypothetical protein
MIAVAVVGIGCGAAVLSRRAAVFRERANLYLLRAGVERSTLSMVARHTSVFDPDFIPRWQRIARFRELARRYDRAARYPWLPLAPDPPEPEW